MITSRSMQHAKRIAEHYGLGPPEQLPYFQQALKDKRSWTLVLGKWRPRMRKPQSEETKQKIAESMKGNTNRRRKNTNEEILH